MDTPDPAATRTYVEAVSVLLAMPLDPEHRDKVVTTLQLLGTLAQDFGSVELDDHVEVAGIYTP